jgi:DNA ligase-1
MRKRELLLAANKADKLPSPIGRYYVSEKLDGMRALWDNLTVGWPTEHVPWANPNCHGKVSTGLWTRLGNPIYYPKWFTFPPYMADGELLGETLEATVSACRKHEPKDSEWKDITYYVFDKPSRASLLTKGIINSLHATYTVASTDRVKVEGDYGQVFEANYLKHSNDEGETWNWLLQHSLKTHGEVEAFMQIVLRAGGEGVMLRNRFSVWEPYRSNDLLKFKPYHDDEAQVVGHTPGKDRHLGAIGGLDVLWHDKRFNIGTGMTDIQRNSPTFAPIGSLVQFRYTSLTEAGIPREARFIRVREDD